MYVFMLSDLQGFRATTINNKNSVNFIKSCISGRLMVLNYMKAWGELIIFCIIWLDPWVLDQLIKFPAVLSKTLIEFADCPTDVIFVTESTVQGIDNVVRGTGA